MSTDPTQHALWPEGVLCHHLTQVDSTMAEAVRIAPTLQAPTWVIADIQTGARGRRGRAWQSPPGNFAATLIYRPNCTPQQASLRSFMAAVALFEALAMYIDRTKLSLKWPNDVLLNGGKIAGILLETSGQGPYVDWLSVGIGVNLAAVPDDVRDAAFAPVSLRGEGGPEVTPGDFLVRLANDYATQEAKLWEFDFDIIRSDWLRHAARLGEVITARTSREEITGTFDTIDTDGNLILTTPEGRKVIPAADIYF
ncbi:biotin--[acetyl-CoA-carboxylase] ligase [Loktanella salsilacus]|nr:biotin--[acetyl-CoA-carboxylase] ligase [Loktanella salsilacus]MBU0781861.1 biotin--[acetyl-CoA-carboxylase] ligase [Alphaproteobacteria bacterium]MBU1837250.1 biotin--[acetyl-CoA-carboxylase] ligase [Alphaproteobacteria bacterium]UTH43267.1 biotin--[acetyl-CoA-carboxylase] ligase [Loktanella salsilacus]UTH46974.1 biotin--[acetyl-CoA-carboxylase] ligase [Loktanella salsilacus]